jgi:hypothetical protein
VSATRKDEIEAEVARLVDYCLCYYTLCSLLYRLVREGEARAHAILKERMNELHLVSF